MRWLPNAHVAEYVARSNKMQLRSKEERMREADFTPSWTRPVPLPFFRRYREHILVVSLIASIAVTSILVFMH